MRAPRLRRPLRLEGPGHALRRVERSAVRAEPLLRAFYALPAFWLATHLDALRPLYAPPPLEPLWPVIWLSWVGPELGAPIILGAFALAALVAPLRPDLRAVRVAVFVSLLELLALSFSFGKIHHLMHGWLFSSFLFALLPARAFSPHRAGRDDRARTLRLVSAAQGMLALTYTLAGVGKIAGSIYQAALGQITPLHPSALARHIAERLLQTHPPSTLGPWMIENGAWLWPAMLGTLYLQLFALPAAFRPRLHRVWGAGLIGFHVVTALSLTIDFSPNILLLGLLFAASPFAPSTGEPRAMLEDLPLIGRIWLWGTHRGCCEKADSSACHTSEVCSESPSRGASCSSTRTRSSSPSCRSP